MNKKAFTYGGSSILKIFNGIRAVIFPGAFTSHYFFGHFFSSERPFNGWIFLSLWE